MLCISKNATVTLLCSTSNELGKIFADKTFVLVLSYYTKAIISHYEPYRHAI